MKKKIKALAFATVAAVMMMMSLTGCGNVDPVGLVKANLDYLCTGEMTEELLNETTAQSEDELKALYKSDIDEAVDALIEELDCEAYATDEKRSVVEEFIKKAMAKAKYEVGEEYTEEDGVYYVPVTVYPMDFLQAAEKYIDGELMDEWENKIGNGTYTFTTEEQLMVDIYDDIFEYLMKAIDETGYLDGVEMKIAVEEADGVMSPNEDDLGEVGAAMIGE